MEGYARLLNTSYKLRTMGHKVVHDNLTSFQELQQRESHPHVLATIYKRKTFIYCHITQVLKICRSPDPTACSKTKIDKVCLKSY